MDKLDLNEVCKKDDKEAYEVFDLFRAGGSTEVSLYKLATGLKLMVEKINEIVEFLNKGGE